MKESPFFKVVEKTTIKFMLDHFEFVQHHLKEENALHTQEYINHSIEHICPLCKIKYKKVITRVSYILNEFEKFQIWQYAGHELEQIQSGFKRISKFTEFNEFIKKHGVVLYLRKEPANGIKIAFDFLEEKLSKEQLHEFENLKPLKSYIKFDRDPKILNAMSRFNIEE